MLELGPLGASLAIAAVLAFMLWFAFGTQANVRRGNAILRWLQGGLPALGRHTTLRWLGSSAAQLDIVEPLGPFREATVLVVLEPRDVPLLWALARARGRRDVIIVRGRLRRAPSFELEAAAADAWLVAEDIVDPAEWRARDWAPGASARAAGDPAPAMLAALHDAWGALDQASGAVWRVSVRRTVPHLEVHVRPPDSARIGADRLIDPIRRLAGVLAGG